MPVGCRCVGVNTVAARSNAATRPNIDKLAADGMLFTHAHANSPNCAPARGALYSGEYCGRPGMYNVADSERGAAPTRGTIMKMASRSLMKS